MQLECGVVFRFQPDGGGLESPVERLDARIFDRMKAGLFGHGLVVGDDMRIILAGDILPRLVRGGGFLLKNPNGFSIDRLSPHALWFARFYESCRSINFLPSSRMFFAAFTSRSCQAPQDGHVHSRMDMPLTCGFR